MPEPRIRDATDADLPALLAIHNHAVRDSTAIWSDTLSTIAERKAWLDEKARRGFAVLVADDGDGLLGYASYGDFRPFPGYVHTVENSVYVRPGCHRRGIGRRLLEALVDTARDRGLHMMVAGIDAGNAPSLALHAALGFTEVARMPEVGKKFGRWLDLVLMQRRL